MKVSFMIPKPLANKRVLVTRAVHQAGKLSEGLRAAGAESIEVPVLEIRPPGSYEPLDQALRHLYGYDWLILTSTNTVRVVAERAAALQSQLAQHRPACSRHRPGDRRSSPPPPAIHVTLIPETYVAESLSYRVRNAHPR